MRYIDFFAIKRIIAEYPNKEEMIREAEMDIISEQSFDITGIRSGVGTPTETKTLKISADKRIERMKMEKAAVEWAFQYIKSNKYCEDILKAVDIHLWKSYDIVATAKKMCFSDSSVKRRLSTIYQAVGAYMGLLE